jgi:hypothetical protein
MTKICSIDGCGKPQEARLYCKSHYKKFRKYGNPLVVKRQNKPKLCPIEGCSKTIKSRGYCGMHYQRIYVHGNPLITKNRDGNNNCGKKTCPAASKIVAHIYYIKNSETKKKKVKEWQDANLERCQKSSRQWHVTNIERKRIYAANRRARQKRAMPSWLTKDQIFQINAVYAEAQRLSMESGKPYDVDHIVPLVGRIVCGLHVPWNLRAIPRSENNKRPKIYHMGMD